MIEPSLVHFIVLLLALILVDEVVDLAAFFDQVLAFDVCDDVTEFLGGKLRHCPVREDNLGHFQLLEDSCVSLCLLLHDAIFDLHLLRNVDLVLLVCSSDSVVLLDELFAFRKEYQVRVLELLLLAFFDFGKSVAHLLHLLLQHFFPLLHLHDLFVCIIHEVFVLANLGFILALHHLHIRQLYSKLINGLLECTRLYNLTLDRDVERLQIELILEHARTGVVCNVDV